MSSSATAATASSGSSGSTVKLTTNLGVPIEDDQNSLKAGPRGGTLMEDFIMREKIMHFDHERIPERVVHARGVGYHGYFQPYEDCSAITKAKFLSDPSKKTPVFVRFSTVLGSKGSPDTVRDVRGFATKFYTEEGNFDLVGNNIPIFFIQDAMKFPDLVHAAKPEPDTEIPQAQSAHNTFWDFAGSNTEITHMLMWAMSDRAIPRSYAMMEGFGVHTFRLINASGESRFVKFHWKPVLGVHGLVWDEAQKIAGKDPDFHRRDIYEAIESGNFPEWEFGVQIVEEKDELNFDFDLLDATKIIPEELVPVKIIGKMVLNRNQDNFFAESEQVAYCATHVVPGIDFSNDPLLQGRLFSYLDTQLTRLGGPNFNEIPINRPVCPYANNQRDGFQRHAVDKGKVAYNKTSFPKNSPLAVGHGNGFSSYPEKMTGQKTRNLSESFADHYSQATLFWNSQTDVEKAHIVEGFSFELGKCDKPVRERVLKNLMNVDVGLVNQIAANIGMPVPEPASAEDAAVGPGSQSSAKKSKESSTFTSPALSMINPKKAMLTGPKARKIAVLVADGVDGNQVTKLKASLEKVGVSVLVLAPKLGPIEGLSGVEPVDTLKGLPSVVFDGVIVPGGKQSIDTLKTNGQAIQFIMEAYVHRKTIGISSDAMEILQAARISPESAGVVELGSGNSSSKDFTDALSLHRHWNRPDADSLPV